MCQKELCPICNTYSDEILKCYNCGAKFHGCCAAEYSISNNIGYKHIFRCPQCESLLKMDEEIVNQIYAEDFEGEEMYIGKDYDEGYIGHEDGESKYSYTSFDEDETEDSLEEAQFEEINTEEPYPEEGALVSEIDPASLDQIPLPTAPPGSPQDPLMKTVKIGGFFGSEITVKDKSKEEQIGQKSSDEFKPIEDKLSITALQPPKRRSSIKFCKICGNSVRDAMICPTCGAKIEN